MQACRHHQQQQQQHLCCLSAACSWPSRATLKIRFSGSIVGAERLRLATAFAAMRETSSIGMACTLDDR